jgi:hypothetical protein
MPAELTHFWLQSPRFKITVEVVFINPVEYRCTSSWMSDTAPKRRLFGLIFSLGNKGKAQETNDNHFADSNKFCLFQGRVGGCFVIKKLVVVSC